MPFDTCYLSVLEHDDEILEFTHQHKVILAGPISIMALIENVTSMQNQEKQPYHNKPQLTKGLCKRDCAD